MADPGIAKTTETRALAARVQSFAAIIRGTGDEEVLGSVAGEDVLPKAQRRRMSVFDQGVARCVMGLAAPGVDEEIVFASRYGNMGVTFDLLAQLVAGELLSPARFSMSVHNAAAGAVSQVAVNRAGHTALAAGARTVTAGLTEAWGRLSTGSASVLFVYSDLPLMEPYIEFDEGGPGVQWAVRLVGASRGDLGVDFAVADGRLGAEGLARALAAGAGRLAWRP